MRKRDALVLGSNRSTLGGQAGDDSGMGGKNAVKPLLIQNQPSVMSDMQVSELKQINDSVKKIEKMMASALQK
jgi:hypothetical protein